MVRPFLEHVTMSELHAIMTGGFATIAGSVLAAYIGIGVSASHLLSASVMSAPAALAVSKLMYPETEIPESLNESDIEVPEGYVLEHFLQSTTGLQRGVFEHDGILQGLPLLAASCEVRPLLINPRNPVMSLHAVGDRSRHSSY